MRSPKEIFQRLTAGVMTVFLSGGPARAAFTFDDQLRHRQESQRSQHKKDATQNPDQPALVLPGQNNLAGKKDSLSAEAVKTRFNTQLVDGGQKTRLTMAVSDKAAEKLGNDGKAVLKTADGVMLASADFLVQKIGGKTLLSIETTAIAGRNTSSIEIKQGGVHLIAERSSFMDRSAPRGFTLTQNANGQSSVLRIPLANAALKPGSAVTAQAVRSDGTRVTLQGIVQRDQGQSAIVINDPALNETSQLSIVEVQVQPADKSAPPVTVPRAPTSSLNQAANPASITRPDVTVSAAPQGINLSPTSQLSSWAGSQSGNNTTTSFLRRGDQTAAVVKRDDGVALIATADNTGQVTGVTFTAFSAAALAKPAVVSELNSQVPPNSEVETYDAPDGADGIPVLIDAAIQTVQNQGGAVIVRAQKNEDGSSSLRIARFGETALRAEAALPQAAPATLAIAQTTVPQLTIQTGQPEGAALAPVLSSDQRAAFAELTGSAFTGQVKMIQVSLADASLPIPADVFTTESGGALNVYQMTPVDNGVVIELQGTLADLPDPLQQEVKAAVEQNGTTSAATDPGSSIQLSLFQPNTKAQSEGAAATITSLRVETPLVKDSSGQKASFVRTIVNFFNPAKNPSNTQSQAANAQPDNGPARVVFQSPVNLRLDMEKLATDPLSAPVADTLRRAGFDMTKDVKSIEPVKDSKEVNITVQNQTGKITRFPFTRLVNAMSLAETLGRKNIPTKSRVEPDGSVRIVYETKKGDKEESYLADLANETVKAAPDGKAVPIAKIKEAAETAEEALEKILGKDAIGEDGKIRMDGKLELSFSALYEKLMMDISVFIDPMNPGEPMVITLSNVSVQMVMQINALRAALKRADAQIPSHADTITLTIKAKPKADGQVEIIDIQAKVPPKVITK